MNHRQNQNLWVWVIIQDPEKNEQILGQHDQALDVSFIPFFEDKEEAQSALSGLARDPGLEHEVQAMRYRDLAGHAARNGFQLFFLNAEGRVLEKLVP